MKNKTLIIAEAGVNHDGDIQKAFELVDIAKRAKADYVKFQTFNTNDLASIDVEKAKYQNKFNSDISHFEMLKSLEFSKTDFKKIINYCKKQNIEFLSTAFDLRSLKFLINESKMDFIKVPSGEIINLGFLFEIAKLKRNTILSTGMATITEISIALNLFLMIYDGCNKKDINLSNLISYVASSKAHKELFKKVTLLQCTTNYPCIPKETNISAIKHLKNTFGLNVGFSDHTLGSTAAVMSVSQGASIIEKHFTYDINASGPDHKASLSPEALTQFVKEVRNAELMHGNYLKQPNASEIKNRDSIRKKLIVKNKKTVSVRSKSGISPLNFFEKHIKPKR